MWRNIFRFSSSLVIILVFGLIALPGRILALSYGTSCGWTGTQCGVSVCTAYEDIGKPCAMSGGQCWCSYSVGCTSSGCWPAACTGTTVFTMQPNSYCAPDPTNTPVPTDIPGGVMYCGNCDAGTCGLMDAAGCATVGDTDGNGVCSGNCAGTTPSACNPGTFIGSTISSTQLNPGQSVNVSCDYGVTPDCIWPDLPTPCTWTGNSGSVINFNCTAPLVNGSYNVSCGMHTGTGGNCCASTNSGPAFNVGPTPTAIPIPTCNLTGPVKVCQNQSFGPFGATTNGTAGGVTSVGIYESLVSTPNAWDTIVTTNGTSVSGNWVFSSLGNHYAVCNAYNTPGGTKCSGNAPGGTMDLWGNPLISWSDCGSLDVLTVTSVTNPSAPGSVWGVDVGNKIDVHWTAGAGMTGYNVYRGTDASGVLLTPVPLASTTTSFVDATAICGSLQSYYVESVNSANPVSCQASGSVGFGSCINYQPWFSVFGGGVVGASGNVGTTIPSGKFMINGSGMVFGRDWYGNLSSANVSTNAWMVKNDSWVDIASKNENKYSALKERLMVQSMPITINAVDPNLITVIDSASNGNKISDVTVGYSGAGLTLNSAQNLNGRKMVILVEGGNVNLNGQVRVGAGGFLAILAKNDINISTTVGEGVPGDITLAGYAPHLEGIFYAQGSIYTGVGVKQLRIDGSLVGMGGVSLQRTYMGQYPAEYVYFRPDLADIMTKLNLRKKVLQEQVNP